MSARERRFARIAADLRLLKWMAGLNSRLHDGDAIPCAETLNDDRGAVIASKAKQSRAHSVPLDCFALLAMTMDAPPLNPPLGKHRPQRRHRVPWRRRRLEHPQPHRDRAQQHMRRRELAPIPLAREQAREGQARFQRVVPSLARTLAVMGDQPVEEFWGAVAGFAVSPNVSPKPSPEASAGRKKPVCRVTTPSAATSSGVDAGKSRNISRDSSG